MVLFLDFHCGQFFLFWEGFSPWFSQSSLLALDWQEQKISSWISVLGTSISWLLGIVNLEQFLSMCCKPMLNTQCHWYGTNASNSEWLSVFMQPVGSIGIAYVRLNLVYSWEICNWLLFFVKKKKPRATKKNPKPTELKGISNYRHFFYFQMF